MSVRDSAFHALRASELLAGAQALEAELVDLEPERRLELAVGGGFAKLNADLRWTAELSIAHALTALALQGLPASIEDELVG